MTKKDEFLLQLIDRVSIISSSFDSYVVDMIEAESKEFQFESITPLI